MAKKLKILVVFGTRPEALKLVPVIMAGKKDPRFRVYTCLTGQHREMVDQVMKLFPVKPDFDLNLMSKNQSLGDLTSRIMNSMEKVFAAVKPDAVMVQGDTTTAFVVGLKAFYEKIPVVHVEAGLRSHNKFHPFPEEMNRVLLSRLSDIHLAPTREAEKNLLKEGIPAKSIFVTGNTVVDALHYMKHALKETRGSGDKRVVLVTAHRRESFGKPLENVFHALKTLAKKFPGIEIIYPVHLNPKVQVSANKILSGQRNIKLIEPLSYEPFLKLMVKSHLILTDSGGIQEEAPSLGKPVLVLREVSERPDGIKMGVAKLVGTDQTKIVKEASRLLTSASAYRAMTNSKKNPYGDGKASEKILKILAAKLPELKKVYGQAS